MLEKEYYMLYLYFGLKNYVLAFCCVFYSKSIYVNLEIVDQVEVGMTVGTNISFIHLNTLKALANLSITYRTS